MSLEQTSPITAESVKIEYEGGHRKAEVIVDQEFPHVEDIKLPFSNPDDLVYIVSNIEPIQIMKHTSSMGRAGFYGISYEEGERIYNCIFVKGTGKPKSFKGFNNMLAPFTIPDENDFDGGVSRIFGKDVIGLSTREDQRLDAERSLQMAKLGIKVRLPMAGFYLLVIEMDSGMKNVEDLVKSGILKESERPYMSYWAMETPYRVGDLYNVICDGGESDVRSFLISATKYTQNILDEKIKRFSLEMGELIENEVSTEQLLERWTDFILDSLDILFDKMSENCVVHHTLHSQNISLHGEICDNSEIDIMVENREDAANLFNHDMNVFFDGFYNLWKNYTKKTGCSTEYQVRFESKAQQIINKFT